MPRIHKPLPFPKLESRPEMSALPNVSDDIQQTLSLLSGYDGSERELLRCSPGGILYFNSPRAADIIKVTATAINYDWVGDSIITNEVVIRADSGNAGVVYVMIDKPYAAGSAWPLAANESLQLSLDNLNNLNIRIVADTEIVYILYTR